jgi:hypothetical protein
MSLRRYLLSFAMLLGLPAHAAGPAPFDLAGPTLEARITRGGVTLPASEVPNLAVGDRIWIKADLPPTQSAHYLLVAAFLTGSTNPPPGSWFSSCRTWKAKCGSEGLSVTVPQYAQQVILFLAPETNADFSTLVNAVQGRPGAFVRASQDLNQAALDRSRLNTYLASVRQLEGGDPDLLKQTAPLLARSLAVKLDEKCLEKQPDMQAACLQQGQDTLILNDGHSTSIVAALTGPYETDLMMQASATPQAGYGYYSPYIASVIDIAHILDSFRTAQYQYIPALATQQGDRLALTLNAPPSFYDPKSVLVVALPAVEPPQLPPLHAVDPKETYCASRTSLVLPVEGAPLVFSTGYAHHITLTLTGKDGRSYYLPAKADAAQGGYVVDTSGLKGAALGDTVRASLQGYWGFEPYRGPEFRLRNAHASSWSVSADDADSLIVGRLDTMHLDADSVSCVDGVMLKDPSGKELKVDWKPVNQNQVEVTLPLKQAQPGTMSLVIKQYGVDDEQTIPVTAFAEAGRFDSFTIHAGDNQGVLKGSNVDEVVGVSLGKLQFLPVPVPAAAQHDPNQMSLAAQDAQSASALKEGQSLTAQVKLRDGRVLPVTAMVDASRPSVSLIGKSVQPSRSGGDSNIQLAGQDEVPQDAVLMFSVRAQTPAAFSRDQAIEVATSDGVFSTTLNLTNGGLRLENARVAVAELDPGKAFGASAFGPLQFRVTTGGAAGDWQPLATLVRLPALRDLKCPAEARLACKLSGSDLFLVDSVAEDARFEHPVQVPDGFPGGVLPVPRPSNGRLYIKLRDDPAVVNQVALTTQQLPPPPPPVPEPAPAAPAPAPAAPAAAPEATAPAAGGEAMVTKPLASASSDTPAATPTASAQ